MRKFIIFGLLAGVSAFAHVALRAGAVLCLTRRRLRSVRRARLCREAAFRALPAPEAGAADSSVSAPSRVTSSVKERRTTMISPSGDRHPPPKMQPAD